LPGRADNDWSGATITLDDTGQSATTDTNGFFTLTDVSPGAYSSITADAPGYLSAACETPTITEPETALAAITLLSGDVDGDDLVDISDATAIGLAFGDTGVASSPDPDINQDEIVNILDVILVGINFGQAGSQEWSCLPE
jgi:hypothetical protein